MKGGGDNMENEDTILSTKELTEQYFISRSTVQRMIAKGMPRIKVGTRNHFSMDQMWAWFKANCGCNPFEWNDDVRLRRDARLANRAFREFNAKFFRNRLSDYKVRVVKSIDGVEDAGGLCDRKNKIIFLHWGEIPIERQRRCTLLHEMCHAVAPQGLSHGWQFRNQLKRLQRMGEGEWVQEELDEFCGDRKFALKWRERVQRRMFGCAEEHPEWTWEEAWKHLGEEFSVDPVELSYWFPKYEFTWTVLGELIRDMVAAQKRRRKVEKLLKAAEAQQLPSQRTTERGAAMASRFPLPSLDTALLRPLRLNSLNVTSS